MHFKFDFVLAVHRICAQYIFVSYLLSSVGYFELGNLSFQKQSATTGGALSLTA